jgi:hypothetical protein
MTTSPTGQDPANGEERDDLTRIRGIGSVTQQLLGEGLDVRTFGDLARLSVDEIESKLRERGQTTSRSEIEGWIARAQELASATESSPQPTSESLEGETARPIDESTEEGEWHSCASFRVEFQFREIDGKTEEQTTARYLDTDRAKIWSGLESDRICQWMLEQLSEARASVQPQGTRKQGTTAVSPPVVKIEQIQILQPPQTDMPIVVDAARGLFPGSLKRGEPFALEIAFSLVGSPEADTAEAPIQCRTQMYARDRATGATISLSDEACETSSDGELLYATALPATTLQKPGIYHLQILVAPEGQPAVPGYFEIPLLQVI